VAEGELRGHIRDFGSWLADEMMAVPNSCVMYDCDVSKFDRVFAATAQLHGFRKGKMTCWGAAHYKEVLAGRQSPKTLGSPREEHLLLLDITSATQALAKVRVRINDLVFVDYLSYHCIDETWLITSKAYYRET
jgi:Putative lumazine-binding